MSNEPSTKSQYAEFRRWVEGGMLGGTHYRWWAAQGRPQGAVEIELLVPLAGSDDSLPDDLDELINDATVGQCGHLTTYGEAAMWLLQDHGWPVMTDGSLVHWYREWPEILSPEEREVAARLEEEAADEGGEARR